MSTAVSIVRTLLGLLFDHTIGNIVRMIPIIRLPKLERGPVSRGFLALLLGILFFGLTMLFSASYSSAYATSGKLYSIIKPQVMIAIVGLFFMWVLSNINYRALRLMSESLYIITVLGKCLISFDILNVFQIRFIVDRSIDSGIFQPVGNGNFCRCSAFIRIYINRFIFGNFLCIGIGTIGYYQTCHQKSGNDCLTNTIEFSISIHNAHPFYHSLIIDFTHIPCRLADHFIKEVKHRRQDQDYTDRTDHGSS